ncbi:hypothetical protein W97_04405 [Coniosporium apollinis CBS 100218]|uniref:Ras family, other n=1 Tax=Coniosporium apollinis (strain CBS 100218) TaxID=1168221 RepID=R7YTK5_CONA1|nr:uncharacterized protein W97_04405 [Coniosporium apollinis CBS 100218]EON65168.1 hypothetical protein W97_04405 [Coniosporium apollinis CBS 100218]
MRLNSREADCDCAGIGKSSITLRLVRSQWTHEYDPTIEDSYSVTRTIDGTPYHLNLTDTAGQEEYRSLWATSNLRSDAFLLVYDITNASSLDNLDHFNELIDMEAEHRLDSGSPPPVKLVAGNKCDLQGQRVVGAQRGLEWARRRGCGFMETSARDMVNVEETFALLVRRVVEARRAAATATGGARFEAAGRTLPLPPVSEKPAVSTAGRTVEQPRGTRGGGGFWSRLKCW